MKFNLISGMFCLLLFLMLVAGLGTISLLFARLAFSI
jgi:hypothetical protein